MQNEFEDEVKDEVEVEDVVQDEVDNESKSIFTVYNMKFKGNIWIWVSSSSWNWIKSSQIQLGCDPVEVKSRLLLLQLSYHY